MLSPAMAAAQSDNGLNGYLCNMQTQAVSDEAEAQLRELFELAGKGWPDDETYSEHCPDCVMPMAALPAPKASLPQAVIQPSTDPSFTSYKFGYNYSATGPPLGSRAPPLSL